MADLGKSASVSHPTNHHMVLILLTSRSLDGKGIFKEGFSRLEEHLNRRCYTSVTTFSEDFGSIINASISVPLRDVAADAHAQLIDESPAKDALPDYKYRKALVSRVIKAVKAPFEDALRKESDLCQKPFEKEFANLDKLLKNSASRRDSPGGSQLDDGEIWRLRSSDFSCGSHSVAHRINDALDEDAPGDIDMEFAAMTDASAEERNPKRQRPTPDSMPVTNGVNGISHNVKNNGPSSGQGGKEVRNAEPPTPPMSSEGDTQPHTRSGIPWYMDPFDPIGTTIQEERWTGRELVRGMSEDLSDMDEEELSGLVQNDAEDSPGLMNGVSAEKAEKAKAKKRKAARAKRRWG